MHKVGKSNLVSQLFSDSCTAVATMRLHTIFEPILHSSSDTVQHHLVVIVIRLHDSFS